MTDITVEVPSVLASTLEGQRSLQVANFLAIDLGNPRVQRRWHPRWFASFGRKFGKLRL